MVFVLKNNILVFIIIIIIIIIIMKTYRVPLQGLSSVVQYNVNQLQKRTNSNMLKTSKSYNFR